MKDGIAKLIVGGRDGRSSVLWNIDEVNNRNQVYCFI